MTAGRGPVVVDTNAFGAELTRRGRPISNAYSRHLEGRPALISFVTEAELRYGARHAGWGEQRLSRLERRLAQARVIWPDRELLDVYVAFRHDCTASGHPLGQKHHEADRWIAAGARWLGLPLVAHDNVFGDAPGVTVITELA